MAAVATDLAAWAWASSSQGRFFRLMEGGCRSLRARRKGPRSRSPCRDGRRFKPRLPVRALPTPRSRSGSAIGGTPFADDHTFLSDARFRLLVDSVKDYAIFMLDPSGKVMTWNAGAERIKGYEASEIIGQHFSRFYEATSSARESASRSLRRPLATAASRTRDGGSVRMGRSSGPTSSSPRCATAPETWSGSPR